MGLPKPYRRIIRPFLHEKTYAFGPDYTGRPLDECHLTDPEYATDRLALLRAFNLIEKDLRTVFDYIEPADDNLPAFSHRLHQLLLRSCTEFEASCRGVLTDNGFTKRSNWNVQDYHRIEQSSRLSEYEVEITAWRRRSKVFRPFESWSEGHSLKWYQDYNTVKHNRSECFALASLENVLLATAGVLAILFSQFSTLCFDVWQPTITSYASGDGWHWVDSGIFRVKPPTRWADSECYDFQWKDIEKGADRFANYPFS